MADGTCSLAEAKAKFSDVVERARSQGPKYPNRNGKDAVVVVAAGDWRRGTGGGKSFIEALLNPAAPVLG
jgi:prevent-host-death family protein